MSLSSQEPGSETWYDPFNAEDTEPHYERPFYKICSVKGVKASVEDNSIEADAMSPLLSSKSELLNVDLNIKLKVSSFNDGLPCVNDDGTDRVGVKSVLLNDDTPPPAPGLFGGRNVSLNVGISSKGWGEEKKGMLGGFLSNKTRAVERSADGVLVQLDARAVEMLWGAAEEFRLAKQRALVRRRMERVAEAFSSNKDASESLPFPSSPNHNLDLKDIEAVDEVLKGVPNHLLPPSLGDEIKGERKRSMLMQQQQQVQLRLQRSNAEDDEEVWEDAEEGVITPPPTQMFSNDSSAVLKTPPSAKPSANSTSPPSAGWWSRVRTTFMSNKADEGAKGDDPEAQSSVSHNPFLQPPLRSTPPLPERPETPKEKPAFHGVISFSLNLPGLKVELSPAESSTTLRRTVQLVVSDVSIVTWFRRCPESWLPRVIDEESKAISVYYFVALSIADAVAWERGTGITSLPVLVNVDVGEDNPKALVARLERSSIATRGSSTSINCKLVPLSVVLDYDLVRRAHRFFVPPTAPISMSVSANKIGYMIKREREMQVKSGKERSYELRGSDYGISKSVSGTSVRSVAAVNSATVFNVTNISSFTRRRRRSTTLLGLRTSTTRPRRTTPRRATLPQ